MNLTFFIQSNTVDLKRYTIKDIPGSSGRMDVIVRCILAALLESETFENIEVWVFLKNYGTFIYNSDMVRKDSFPRNELLLTDSFVKLIKSGNSPEELIENPISDIKKSNLTIIDAIKFFKEKGCKIFILNEQGVPFSKFNDKFQREENLLFVIGDQSGTIIDSKSLIELNFPNISLGNRSFLASSVIRLIKMNLSALI